MTTVKILAYTDTREIRRIGSKVDWTLFTLFDLLESNSSEFIQFKGEVVNRYDGFVDNPTSPQTPIRLTPELLDEFDEIWFFGVRQQNVDKFSTATGGPDNELSPDEVKAIEDWMNKKYGGVLMAGDHANAQPGDTSSPDPQTFRGLGRALGHLVPRAGKLRKWEGPPTTTVEQFDTIATGSENDSVPQKLVLHPVRPDGMPHELFWGKDAGGNLQIIDVFPDHEHEGRLEIPNLDEWPSKTGVQTPRPLVVASGRNNGSAGDVQAVLAVYDGDPVGVGRIVADSSWHHYMDLNLGNFKKSPAGEDALKLIGQLYKNIALFLTPFPKRQEMAQAMLNRAVRHPEIAEVLGGDPVKIGRAADRLLSRDATQLQLHEMLHVLLQPTSIETKGTSSESMFFLPQALGNGFRLSREAVIGSIINRRFQVHFDQMKPAKEGFTEIVPEDPISAGLREALTSHISRLEEAKDAVNQSLHALAANNI